MAPRYRVTKIIGSKIKKIRKEYGLTAAELAAVLNVSQQQFSRYERGINRIDIDSLFIISNYLRISIHYFLEDISPENTIELDDENISKLINSLYKE